MLFRRLLNAASTCAVALAPGHAAAPVGTAPGDVTPELAALLAEQPAWSTSAALQGGFGYKDNILLSSSAQEASEFVRYGAEVFFWRLPRGHTDFSAFLTAEQTSYTSGESVEDEAQAFAQMEWRYRLGTRGKFALAAMGYYLDEVFDVSDTEIQRLVAELKVRGVTLGPTLRWTLWRGGWIEGQAVAKREKYEDGANDSRVREGTVRLGWTASRVELSVAGILTRRRFDRREQYSEGGRPLDNLRLAVDEREVEGRLHVQWDTDKRWQTTTRASALRYEDNGPGFFDYHERKVSQELEWTGGGWTLGLEGSATRHEFDVQTVGFGVTPPPRVKDEFEARVRVVRTLSPQWTVFAEYHWERSRSNDWLASYRVNEGLLGARWSWEK